MNPKKNKADKEIIVYGGLKYFEFLTNAYLFLSLAKLVTPAEYGMASPAFLLITYCSFVVLGVNQVVVKWYSKELSGSFRFFLLKYCFYYNLIFSLLLFAGVFYY